MLRPTGQSLTPLKASIGDRQEELAVDEDDGLSVSGTGVQVHWPDTPSPCQGVGGGNRGGGSVFYLPQVKLLIIRYLHSQGEVGEVCGGDDKP